MGQWRNGICHNESVSKQASKRVIRRKYLSMKKTCTKDACGLSYHLVLFFPLVIIIVSIRQFYAALYAKEARWFR